jgi:ribosomal protein L7Ae-like RNA K-turn-binding protein
MTSTKRRVFKQRAQAFRDAVLAAPASDNGGCDNVGFGVAASEQHRDPAVLQEMNRLVAELEVLYDQRHSRTQDDVESKPSTKVLWKLRRAKAKLLHLQAVPNNAVNGVLPSVEAAGVFSASEPTEVIHDKNKADEVDAGGLDAGSQENDQETLTAELTTSLLRRSDNDATSAPTVSCSAVRRKRNFYPTMLQLGVGLHPLASMLDTRDSKPTKPDADETPPIIATHQTRHCGLVREYCVNLMTNDLDSAAASLLRKLQGAQKKLKSEQPLHLRARMRFQCGLREVARSIIAKRVRLVLVAPDVEPVVNEREQLADAAPLVDVPKIVAEAQTTRRGIDGTVRTIIDLCSERSIPWACCLSREAMGRALKLGRSQVSVVAILSADGAYDEYRSVVAHLRCGLEGYQALLEEEKDRLVARPSTPL